MMAHRLAAALLLWPCLAAAQAQPFDGPWLTTLVCDDLRDDDGRFTKGYRFEFLVTVQAGVLRGQHGEPGQNGSVRFAGDVLPDGLAHVRASGFTGKPEHTPNRRMPGTPYAYTLVGRFDGDRAVLDRQELRPCRASFVRQPRPAP